MRSIKELLQIMLDNKQYFFSGLCSWSNEIHCNGLINGYEWKTLREYIDKNRPSKFSSIDAFKSRKSGYYWKNGNINPRIKWIKKHIKKNS